MRKQKVLVLGAGISGLTAAWTLRQRGYEVRILEASQRAGGWVRTSLEHGYLFEHGPRGFRPRGNGLQTLELIRELGLQDQVIAADSTAKRRYIRCGGQLCPLPLSRLRLAAALVRDCFTRQAAAPSESVYAFFRRRFGAHVADKYCQAMVTGIFAGDAQQLAISACFPLLHEWEQKHRSITWAMFVAKRPKSRVLRQFQKAPLCSLRAGMETLTRRLAEELEAELHFGTEVHCWSSSKDEITVHSSQGSFSADYCVSCIPDKALKHSSLALVACGYPHKVLAQRGFGYLVPPEENSQILGMVWDSEVFPQQDRRPEQTRLTVMMGGSRDPLAADEDESSLKQRALNAIACDLHIDVSPEVCTVSRAHAAIPQYDLQYPQWKEKQLAHSAQEHPRLKVLGTSYRGVAVNDCIAAGRQLDLKAGEN